MGLRIAIAGAGVGGLAAAAFLARDGHRVTVFEAFDRARPVGSGLVIQPVGQAVLAALGLLDAALATGAPIRRLDGRTAGSNRLVLDVAYDPTHGHGFGLGIHRAALFDLLHDAAMAAGADVRPGHPVADAANGRVALRDGRIEDGYDLVVDASGANSALSPLRSTPLPFGAIWGTVPWPTGTDLPADRLSQVYCRASRMVGVLPIGRMTGSGADLAAIFWSLRVDAVAAWQAARLDAWKADAIGLWPAFAPFLDTVACHADMTFARYSHGTLLRPFRDGVVFIGDAAHRASPQLGQGANMALLDALALRRAVAAHADVGLVGRTYHRMRRAHTRAYQAFSRVFTPLYQSDGRVAPALRDHLFAPLSRVPPMPRILGRLVSGDLLPPLGWRSRL